ncbi:GNAT family N-acetyltransferase [uncultured Flavobacterium sp.]|uniref:GNAT family N-acetyltransferase n=1 Tax=uncultured Flavobacterium sp. TaxID=165435 RepID=UPI0030EC66E2|tara:strand:- start:7994 stop:8977 length:984 start_codon:yes stop_codon:yes gene_type:complete
MIEVKYYSKEFERAHIKFAQKYWTKKRRFTPEYIYWKFRGIQSQTLKSFLLAFDGDEVVGQIGLVPSQVVLGKKNYEAQWACDLMVDNDYRGKGVAEKLYDFAHENKPITLGSDPSPAAEKSMVRRGYVSLKGPRKFVFPFNIGEILKLKGINNRFMNMIPNPFLAFLFLLKKTNYTLIDKGEYAQLNNITFSKELQCKYDEVFYNWRFSEFKPYYKGIECYKKDTFNFFSGYFVNGIYFLTDYKVSNLSAFLRMTSFIYFKHRKFNIQRIKFISMNFRINSILPFIGFIRFRTITKIILFTKSIILREEVKNRKFYYTLYDSDENI